MRQSGLVASYIGECRELVSDLNNIVETPIALHKLELKGNVSRSSLTFRASFQLAFSPTLQLAVQYLKLSGITVQN
jgi:hypothetical protein